MYRGKQLPKQISNKFCIPNTFWIWFFYHTLQEHEETQVNRAGGHEDKIKDITVQNNSGSIKVSLWDEYTTHPNIKVGKDVNVVTTVYRGDTSLNTCQSTSIQEGQVVKTDIEATVIGDIIYELLTHDDTFNTTTELLKAISKYWR